MKLAVLSDIHGNLTALNAVLEDINKSEIDGYIIAGDHVIDCPQNNEVLEKIKNLDAYVIKGNREKYIMNYHNGMHSEWDNHKQMAAVVWAYNNMDEDNINYIDNLPEQLNISLANMDTIRVVHGSPFNISEQLFPDKYPERIEKSLRSIKESVLICGHTHESWSKIVHKKLVVNPGSVGIPFNDNMCAEYAILTWMDNRWIASHHQVKYDLEEVEQMFNGSELFQECRAWSRLTLRSIKEGKDINMEFIKYAYKLAEDNGYNNLELVPDCIWDRAEEDWLEKY